MFKIKTYNAISVKGLERFARDKFEVGSSIEQPDAILLRSHKLQGEPVPEALMSGHHARIERWRREQSLAPQTAPFAWLEQERQDGADKLRRP